VNLLGEKVIWAAEASDIRGEWEVREKKVRVNKRGY